DRSSVIGGTDLERNEGWYAERTVPPGRTKRTIPQRFAGGEIDRADAAIRRSCAEHAGRHLPSRVDEDAIGRSRLRTRAFSLPPQRWDGGPTPGGDPAASQGSELHHRPADDLIVPLEIEIFVDLVETDGLDGVLDLAFSGERHDLAQVRVVAPEGPMKRLLARHPRDQRDVDAIGNEADIGIVTADRQQSEAQLHHLRCAGAVDDRIELVLARGLLELLADIACRLALDIDEVVSTILLCDCKLARIAGERD